MECVREPSKEKDHYAVAVLKDGNTVGHLPKKISLVSDDSCLESEPLGSGNPSLGFKYWRRDISGVPAALLALSKQQCGKFH